MANLRGKLPAEDSPQEMMKRLFAVAHLILHSDHYETVTRHRKGDQKHKTKDVLYSGTQQNQ